MKSIGSRVILSAAVAALLASCATDAEQLGSTDELPSWEEFVAKTYKEPWEGGVYIIDGDTPVATLEDLRAIYDQAYTQGALAVMTVGGADDKWSATAKLNISYCVSSSSFGSNYSRVVSAMTAASGAWEAVSNVNFVHLTQYDSSCTASQSGVVFDVRQVTGGSYLARAFFPSSGRSSRNVLIDTTSFGSISPWTLTGILRHELGHTLGYRHEHTRLSTNSCYEDSNWRGLTTYDSASVMHYPQCAGTQTGDLVITTKDAQGSAALYGAPGDGGGGGGTTTWTGSGSVASSAWFRPAAFSVKAGTTFTVNMTGSGDPDLYVRFGSAPTTSTYTCRPWLDGATESCNVTVPTGATAAHVGVYGYAAGTYNLTVTYTKP